LKQYEDGFHGLERTDRQTEMQRGRREVENYDHKRREIERRLDRYADRIIDSGRGVTEKEGDAGS